MTLWFGYMYIQTISNKLAEYFMPPFDENDTSYVYKYCKPLVYLFKKLMYYGQQGLPEELKCDIDLTKSYPTYFVNPDIEFLERVKAKTIKVIKGVPSQFTSNGIIVSNQEIPADVVVFATGFTPNYCGLNKDKPLLWLYRYMLVPCLLYTSPSPRDS